MEVDSIVVDNINEDHKAEPPSEHSCLQSHRNRAQQQVDDMATTAAPGPLRMFQDPRSIASSDPVQLFDSAELSFATNKQRKVRINKCRATSHQPSPSLPAAAVQNDAAAKRYSAQVAPVRRGFASRTGSTDSLPGLTSGMVVCPHLHPLEPEDDIRPPATFYTPVAIAEMEEEEERDSVAVHQLDTRLDTVDDAAAATRLSVSPPPPLPPPASSLDDGARRVFAQDPVSKTGILDSDSHRRPLHRPLTRQGQRQSLSQSVHDQVTKYTSPPVDPPAASSLDSANLGRVLLISPDQDAPILIGKTKPVPPPKVPLSEVEERESLSSSSRERQLCYPPRDGKLSPSPRHQRHSHNTKILQSTASSPAIFGDSSSPTHHRRKVSFHICKAGEELGQFRADYLGSKDIDGYVNVTNSVARQLVDQRPAEVIAYVSSQKIRLAPPNNEAVLFKSFAIKDILMVEKSTINKRIIGIIVWKSKTQSPTCHALRCPDELVSKALYEAVWEQTQIYDDEALSKVSGHLRSVCVCVCVCVLFIPEGSM